MAVSWRMELEDATAKGGASIKATMKAIAKDAGDAFDNIESLNDAIAQTGGTATEKQLQSLRTMYIQLAGSVRHATGAADDLSGRSATQVAAALETEGRKIFELRKRYNELAAARGEAARSAVQSSMDLNDLARKAADLNLLPRGHEMQVVRLTRTVTELIPKAGKLTGEFASLAKAAALIGPPVLASASILDRMAEKGDAAANRLRTSWGELSKEILSLPDRMTANVPRMQRAFADTALSIAGVRPVAKWGANAANDLLEAGTDFVRHGTIFGPGEDKLSNDAMDRRAADAKVREQIHRERLAGDAQEAQRLADTREFRGLERGGATKGNLRLIDQKVKDAKDRGETLSFSIRKLTTGDAEKDAANPMLANLNKQLAEVTDRAKQLSALRVRLVDEAEVRLTARYAEVMGIVKTNANDFAVILPGLVAKTKKVVPVDELKNAAEIQREMLATQKKLQELYQAELFTTDEFIKNAERYNDLLARRKEEEQYARNMLREQRQMMLEMGEIRNSVIVHTMDVELGVHKDSLELQKRRTEELRSAGGITNAEADAQQRLLIENKKELEFLEKKHKIQRDTLEAKKKEIELSKQQAKTVEESRAADARMSDVALQGARLMVAQQRELFDLEAAKARELKKQQVIEDERRMAIEMDAMKKANEEQRKWIEGGVMNHIRESVSPTRVDAQIIKQRVDERVAKQQTALGRKLRASERAKIGRDVRMDVMREKRGPSERQIAIERGKLLKNQRAKIRADAKAAGKLPAEIRELERQAIRGDVARNNARQGELGAVAAAGLNRPIQDEREKAALALQRQAANSVQMGEMARQNIQEMLDREQALIGEMQKLKAQQQILNEQVGILMEQPNRARLQRGGQ